MTIPTIAGPPGVSPTVSTEEIDGGTRVTFTFQGGSETVDLLNGKDGKTPVKGTDYFTEAEIQDVAKQAAELVPGGGGSLPKLVNTVVTDAPAAAIEILGSVDNYSDIEIYISMAANAENIDQPYLALVNGKTRT